MKTTLKTYRDEITKAEAAYLRACQDYTNQIAEELRNEGRVLNKDLAAREGLLPSQMYSIMKIRFKPIKVKKAAYFMEVNEDGTPIEGSYIQKFTRKYTAWELKD